MALPMHFCQLGGIHPGDIEVGADAVDAAPTTPAPRGAPTRRDLEGVAMPLMPVYADLLGGEGLPVAILKASRCR
jgi:hypothetical protein